MPKTAYRFPPTAKKLKKLRQAVESGKDFEVETRPTEGLVAEWYLRHVAEFISEDRLEALTAQYAEAAERVVQPKRGVEKGEEEEEEEVATVPIPSQSLILTPTVELAPGPERSTDEIKAILIKKRRARLKEGGGPPKPAKKFTPPPPPAKKFAPPPPPAKKFAPPPPVSGVKMGPTPKGAPRVKSLPAVKSLPIKKPKPTEEKEE